MTNKPMLSVERDLIERAVQAIINTSQMQPALNELRALLDKPAPSPCQTLGCFDNAAEGWRHCEAHKFYMLREPAAQHQGEPVACLVRNRNLLTQASIAVDGKDHFSTWSEWEPNSLEYGRAVTDPLRNDPVCYEMELLFKEQPAPVAVACSDKEDMLYDCAYRNGVMFGYGIGINGAEDDYQKCINRLQEQIIEARRVARLNGVKP